MEKTSPRKNNSQWSSSMRMMMPSSPWVTQRQRKRETEISSNTRYKEVIYHIKHWMRPTQKRSTINSKTKSRRHTKMQSIVRHWMSRSLIRRLLRRASKSNRRSTSHPLRIGIKEKSVIKFLFKMTPMKNRNMELLTLLISKQSVNSTEFLRIWLLEKASSKHSMPKSIKVHLIKWRKQARRVWLKR